MDIDIRASSARLIKGFHFVLPSPGTEGIWELILIIKDDEGKVVSYNLREVKIKRGGGNAYQGRE